MDVSALSDADLEALASGDMAKVSNAGLEAIAGNGQQTAQPASKGINWRVSKQDIQNTAGDLRRIGGLALRGHGLSAADFLMLPANAGVEARNVVGNLLNKVRGAEPTPDYRTPSQMLSQYVGEAIPPPRNAGERLFEAGVGLLTTAKGQIPGLETPAALATPIEDTARQARSSGYVVDPSDVRPTVLNRITDAIFGKKEILADATQRNAKAMQQNMVSELGLPKGTNLTDDAIEAVVSNEGKAYEDIASLGPGYADAIETVKRLRNTASKYFKQSASNYSVDAEQKAQEAWDKAKNVDDLIAKALQADGKKELFDEYLKARTNIAKAYDVQKAIIQSSGSVKASAFAKLYGKRKPITGEIGTLGRTAEAFPKAFSTPEGSPWHGIDQFIIGTGVGTGVLMDNPMYGALLAASGVGRHLGRKGLLSSAMQDYLFMVPKAQKDAAMAEAVLKGSAASGIFR